MKKKLIMSTVAMTVMLGFNRLAFADTINNNENTQNDNKQELTYNNGYVNSDRVNFRKGASTNSDIYKVLDKNTSVTILDYEGDWSKVKINDTVGYVYTKYITAGNKVIDASNIDESNTVSLDVKATAYAGDTITSTGTVPTEGTTIAVDPSVIPYGVMQARIIALFYCLLAFSHCIAAVLRGSGHAAVPMIVMLCDWCLFRVSYITVAVRLISDIRVIFWAYPLTWSISSVIFLYLFLRGKWVYGFEKEK